MMDLPPTLLDAAGLPVPEEMKGRSILPLLRGETNDWPDEVYVQISESQVGRAIRTDRWKYCMVAPDKEPWFDPVSDKYVDAHLYDLKNDPHELNDLIAGESHREIIEEMRERIMRRMMEAGEPEPVIKPHPDL